MPARIVKVSVAVPPAAIQLLKTMPCWRGDEFVHTMDDGGLSVTTAELREKLNVTVALPAGTVIAFTSKVYASFTNREIAETPWPGAVIAFFVRVTVMPVGASYSANDAPERTMSNVPDVNCFAVKVKDVERAPAVSPTTHVFAPPKVTSHAAAVRPAPDVSVAVTVDHGLHDAVSVIVTVLLTEREIEAKLDVTVHFVTILNESVGDVPMLAGVNAMGLIALSTTVPVTVMSKKDAVAELHVDNAGTNDVDVRK